MPTRLIKTLASISAAILLASCTLLSCVRDHAAAQSAASGTVTVNVARVGFDQDLGSHYVTLIDRSGNRSLDIVIGPEEAREILFELHGLKPERPLASDLLRTVVERAGVHVERVEITGLRDQTYFAAIDLDGQRQPIDSRPSDAIALALGVGAPIYVKASLMSAKANAPNAGPAVARAAGIAVQELTPELAEYFSLPPESGVVVADFEAAQAQSGLRRGDIVTAIDGHEIKTTDDFVKAAASAKRPLVLSVRRGGRALSITLAPAATAASAH
jgi:bifunctional DNase/RNase